MSADSLKPPFYNFLGQPTDAANLTDDQRAVLAATEMELGMEMALGSGIPGEISAMLAWVDSHGWWAEVKTPFMSPANEKYPQDRVYWVGLTPHGTSGWGGRPDHQVGDVTLRGALWRAVLLMLIQERMPDPTGLLPGMEDVAQRQTEGAKSWTA